MKRLTLLPGFRLVYFTFLCEFPYVNLKMFIEFLSYDLCVELLFKTTFVDLQSHLVIVFLSSTIFKFVRRVVTKLFRLKSVQTVFTPRLYDSPFPGSHSPWFVWGGVDETGAPLV